MIRTNEGIMEAIPLGDLLGTLGLDKKDPIPQPEDINTWLDLKSRKLFITDEITEDTVECVVINVGRYYNYTERISNTPIIIKTDEFTEKGYLCRDIAVAYNAIFTKLGFNTDYVFTKNHVYNTIYYIGDDYIDCQLNMDQYHCWGF
jgi:hypothetical protein